MNRSEKNKPILYQTIISIIGGLFFILIMKYIFWWVPNLAAILEVVQPYLRESILWKIVGMGSLIFLAFSLITLKRKLIGAFGILEFIGGVWTIWVTFNQNTEHYISYALAVGGGIFLIVNGLENITAHSKRNKTN